MDKKKVKKIVLIVLIIILVAALLFAIGLAVLIYGFKSFEPFEFQMSIPADDVRDFIVDSVESLLPQT